MRLSRSEPIEFEIAGKRYTVPPPLREQIRRCVKLDPEPGERETRAQADARRARQIAVLVERCPEFPLQSLTTDQESEILAAIESEHNNGQRPLSKGKPTPKARILEHFDSESSSIAVFLHVSLAQADAQPYLDSIFLLDGIFTARKDELKVQAALHGMELK